MGEGISSCFLSQSKNQRKLWFHAPGHYLGVWGGALVALPESLSLRVAARLSSLKTLHKSLLEK